VRLSLIVLKVEVKEEIHELLISGRKCALREIGAQIKLYVLQWTSGHLAKRLILLKVRLIDMYLSPRLYVLLLCFLLESPATVAAVNESNSAPGEWCMTCIELCIRRRENTT